MSSSTSWWAWPSRGRRVAMAVAVVVVSVVMIQAQNSTPFRKSQAPGLKIAGPPSGVGRSPVSYQAPPGAVPPGEPPLSQSPRYQAPPGVSGTRPAASTAGIQPPPSVAGAGSSGAGRGGEKVILDEEGRELLAKFDDYMFDSLEEVYHRLSYAYKDALRRTMDKCGCDAGAPPITP